MTHPCLNPNESHDEIGKRLSEQTIIYQTCIGRIAELTLLDLMVLARDAYGEEARWIGLSTTDQDGSGGQWAACVVDADGKLLDETGDAFQECPTLNLDDANFFVWSAFICGPPYMHGLFGDAFEGTSERYLDLIEMEKLT